MTMPRTVAELSTYLEGFGVQVVTAQRDITVLRATAEADREAVRAGREEAIRFHEQLAQVRRELDEVREFGRQSARAQDDVNTGLRRANADLRQENAVLRQRLDDHLKRVETWDGRRWALLVLLIGAVLSLASGLIVTLARK